MESETMASQEFYKNWVLSMKEHLALALEYLSQSNIILLGCIKSQEKKIEDLRKIQYISIQITQSIELLSHLRSLHRDVKALMKQLEKEIQSISWRRQ